MASGHAEGHVTLFQDWGTCGYSGLYIWVGSGHPPPLHHSGGGVQFFYRMFGQETIVGPKCLFCYTGSRQEVGQKKEETMVSNDF